MQAVRLLDFALGAADQEGFFDESKVSVAIPKHRPDRTHVVWWSETPQDLVRRHSQGQLPTALGRVDSRREVAWRV